MADLATNITVSAIIRLAEQAGGSAAVIKRGDPDSGTISLSLYDRTVFAGVWERVRTLAGGLAWAPLPTTSVSDDATLTDYLARRAAVDRDLWIVELNVADATRFVGLLSAAN